MGKVLDGIIHQLNTRMREQFSKLPDKQFIYLNKLGSYIPAERSPIIVLYKIVKPIVNINIEVQSSLPLAIGKIHYLVTGNFHFAYLLEFPQIRVVRGRNFFGVERNSRKVKEYNFKLEHTNKHLNVFSSNSDATLIADNSQFWVDRQGWHGRRAKKDE